MIRKEDSFSTRHPGSSTRIVPAIASHNFANPAAPKIWKMLSLPFWKRVIRKRATRLFVACSFLLALWRTPPTACALDEIAGSSNTIETIGIDKTSEEQVVIQPFEIASKKKTDVKKKSVIIAIGVSGATFAAVRRSKRYKANETDKEIDLDDQQKPSESTPVNEMPILQGTNSASLSSRAIEQIGGTRTESIMMDRDDSNDSDTTTDTSTLVKGRPI
jgi:hypothetical protein